LSIYWFILIYSTFFLNLFIIIKSIYYKNLLGFIFFSAWLGIYTIQEIIIIYDLVEENSVKYLNVIINHDGFKIAAIIHFIFLITLFFIKLSLPKNPAIYNRLYFCNFKCKVFYSVIFFTMMGIFFYKLGGISNIIHLSRPANITGLSMFLFFFVSAKIFLIATYKKKFDRYFLFLYILTLIIFSMTSRQHLLMSIVSIMTFVWIFKIRMLNYNIFNLKTVIAISTLPIGFLLLGLVKLRNNSVDLIMKDGLISYFSTTFESLWSFIYLMYKIAIEGFSNIAAFFSKNGLEYMPNFLVGQLDFFAYFIPGGLRGFLSDYTIFVNSFTNVEGNVPPVFTYIMESFHILGILVMFLLFYFIFRLLFKLFYCNGFKFFFYLILLNNSILIIRGTPENFIAYVYYDLIGLLLLYLLSNKSRKYENIN
jgi:hypothetical protein